MARSNRLPVLYDHIVDSGDELKHSATHRLLDWGFDPTVIHVMTGCDESWIEALNEERLRSPRQQ